MPSYSAKYGANQNAQMGVFCNGLEHAVLRERKNKEPLCTYFELFPPLGPSVGWWRTSANITIYNAFWTLPLKAMLSWLYTILFCKLAEKGDVYSVFELSACQPQCREGCPIMYSLFLRAAIQKKGRYLFLQSCLLRTK